MLGDSVVAVKHCMDPRSGKVSRRTWTMLGIGAACLAAAAIAFGVSVHVAAMNKAGLEYWTHVLHKPAYSFRGTSLAAAYDFVTFGGLSLGLSLIVAGLFRVRDEKKSPYYRIGSAPGVELALEQAPTPDFPLVAPRGDEFVFNYAPGIEGELVLDGNTTPLAELAAKGVARPSPTIVGAFELPITDRAKIRAKAGLATMLVSSVERPRRQAVPVMAALESRTLKYFAGSLAAHLGIWAVLQMVPAEDSAAAVDLASSEDQNMHVVNVDHEDKTEVATSDEGGDQSEAGEMNKAKLALGEAGDKKPGNDPQRIQLKNRDNDDPHLSREAAIEEARREGILGDMPSLMSGVSSVAAEYDFTTGFDTSDRPGGVFDGTGGGGPGFGLGRTGFGGGGGCTHAPCGIGVGDYNLTGIGNRMGNGYGIGPGKGPGLRGYHPTAPEPRIGQATIGGEYDKAIIRRYIKRNIDKIAYCYEHELLAKPSLQGEITVQFFIQPNGSVKGSTGAGFDSHVAGCVADVVGAIEFPAPKDGGGIQVNYPFTFHPAGH